jgi:hypothetical protein
VNRTNCRKNQKQSCSDLNLRDFLFIRNWINYAKGIGDHRVHLIKQDTISSQEIYNIAKMGLEKYP